MSASSGRGVSGRAFLSLQGGRSIRVKSVLVMGSKNCLVNAYTVVARLSARVICRDRVCGFQIYDGDFNLAPRCLLTMLDSGCLQTRVRSGAYALSVVGSLNGHRQRLIVPVPGSGSVLRAVARRIGASVRRGMSSEGRTFTTLSGIRLLPS